MNERFESVFVFFIAETRRAKLLSYGKKKKKKRKQNNNQVISKKSFFYWKYVTTKLFERNTYNYSLLEIIDFWLICVRFNYSAVPSYYHWK